MLYNTIEVAFAIFIVTIVFLGVQSGIKEEDM